MQCAEQKGSSGVSSTYTVWCPTNPSHSREDTRGQQRGDGGGAVRTHVHHGDLLALALVGLHGGGLDDLDPRGADAVQRRHLRVQLVHGAVQRHVTELLVHVLVARAVLYRGEAGEGIVSGPGCGGLRTGWRACSCILVQGTRAETESRERHRERAVSAD